MRKKTVWFLAGLLALLLLGACAQPNPGIYLDIPIPADLPVFGDAAGVGIDVTGAETIVTYLANDTEVGVLVDYYEEALISAGWQETNQADVQTDTEATLVRVNEDGDEITVFINHNEGLDTVQVEVNVERANP